MNRSFPLANSYGYTHMLKHYSLLFIGLFLSFSVWAVSADVLYQEAGTLYQAGKYDEAIKKYEKIVVEGHREAAVYYNLGNAYYKENQLGKAILNYERAKLVAPQDEDVQHNLQLAQQKTLDKIQEVPQLAVITYWQNFLQLFSSSSWGNFALVFLWVAFVFSAIYLFVNKMKWLSVVTVLLTAISLGILTLAYTEYSKENCSEFAVLMSKSVVIKSAPNEKGDVLFQLHEGTKIRLVDEVGEWRKIKLADGKVGWVQVNHLQRI